MQDPPATVRLWILDVVSDECSGTASALIAIRRGFMASATSRTSSVFSRPSSKEAPFMRVLELRRVSRAASRARAKMIWLRDLIPWNREDEVTIRNREEANPFLTPHRKMNRPTSTGCAVNSRATAQATQWIYPALKLVPSACRPVSVSFADGYPTASAVGSPRRRQRRATDTLRGNRAGLR
jgi:hypothetical protein